MNGCAIRCKGLVKRYADVTAVDGLDLEVRSGECFGLLGPNGAGKTTLLRLLTAEVQPLKITCIGGIAETQIDSVATCIYSCFQRRQIAGRTNQFRLCIICSH